jgi:hypothetical protein
VNLPMLVGAGHIIEVSWRIWMWVNFLMSVTKFYANTEQDMKGSV